MSQFVPHVTPCRTQKRLTAELGDGDIFINDFGTQADAFEFRSDPQHFLLSGGNFSGASDFIQSFAPPSGRLDHFRSRFNLLVECVVKFAISRLSSFVINVSGNVKRDVQPCFAPRLCFRIILSDRPGEFVVFKTELHR